MSSVFQNHTDVEHLVLNARLREEIEPYQDESLTVVDLESMTTEAENCYLQSMLAWEKAPVVPIRDWFEPVLSLPAINSLTAPQIEEILAITTCLLFEKGIVLQYTDHLSDRELYLMLQREILPSEEKKVDRNPTQPLVWQCIDRQFDEEIWLTYYADEFERNHWEQVNGRPAPMRLVAPYPRETPELFDGE